MRHLPLKTDKEANKRTNKPIKIKKFMLKTIIELFPVVFFFAAFKLTNDMFKATAVAIVCAVLQVGLMKWQKIQIKPIHWFSAGLVIILGGISIYVHNPMFLKWKFSVLEWCLGAAILIGQFAFNKNMLKLLLGQELTLPDGVWKKLGLMWAAFFIFLGILNIYIAYQYDDAVWVNFKTYGSLGLTMAFMLVQSLWISRHMQDDTADTETL
jgi:intracellular septation protein